MEPTEHPLQRTAEKDSESAAPERSEQSRAEIFTYDLDRVNAVITDMLQSDATNVSELREAWNIRADLADNFINSLEPTQDSPNPKARVQFDIFIDKALIFEAVGNTIRYLEELDDAEAFARTYHLVDMTESVAQELEERVKGLGDTPEELILKLRGQLSFPMRYKLRQMLQDGIDYAGFITNLNTMLLDNASGPKDMLAPLNDAE
ncbi:MAG TPA: hypothetical protein VLG09_05940 [Candidatus Saccharimonadales bacterium]|nr:hypothetical protein [Candidatus Saccharimonadales bacterium]